MSLTIFLGGFTNDEIMLTKNKFELHPSMYGKICYDMMCDIDYMYQSLINRITYLRIFFKEPTESFCYLECYIREIDHMLPEQLTEAKSILECDKNPDIVLIELCYTNINRGFFFLYNIRTNHAYQPM